MDFEKRYSQLNTAQRRAVDLIDGPVMVIAGPGTGKTELLSVRTANILKKTDTLPENILCLTFTESGATEKTLIKLPSIPFTDLVLKLLIKIANSFIVVRSFSQPMI
jgi:superfamily I DNA and RNA helicase